MADLRHELEYRSLSPKGLKSQLIARLCKAVKSEQEEDDKETEDDKVRGVAKKTFPKSELTMEVGGWVQVLLGISVENRPKIALNQY